MPKSVYKCLNCGNRFTYELLQKLKAGEGVFKCPICGRRAVVYEHSSLYTTKAEVTAERRRRGNWR